MYGPQLIRFVGQLCHSLYDKGFIEVVLILSFHKLYTKLEEILVFHGLSLSCLYSQFVELVHYYILTISGHCRCVIEYESLTENGE